MPQAQQVHAHSWDNLAGPDVHQDEYCDPPCEHMDAETLLTADLVGMPEEVCALGGFVLILLCKNMSTSAEMSSAAWLMTGLSIV